MFRTGNEAGIRMFLRTSLLVAAALAAGDAAWGADLRVSVTGLRSAAGDVHIALYDRAEAFPRSRGMLKDVQVTIRGNTAGTVFTGLAPGEYALAVYHDENGNDEFDQGFLGIPLEDYAFSAGARAFFGPPSFAEAKVTVPPNGLDIVIPIR